jgi:hypothetical protein
MIASMSTDVATVGEGGLDEAFDAGVDGKVGSRVDTGVAAHATSMSPTPARPSQRRIAPTVERDRLVV